QPVDAIAEHAEDGGEERQGGGDREDADENRPDRNAAHHLVRDEEHAEHRDHEGRAAQQRRPARRRHPGTARPQARPPAAAAAGRPVTAPGTPGVAFAPFTALMTLEIPFEDACRFGMASRIIVACRPGETSRAPPPPRYVCTPVTPDARPASVARLRTSV